MHGGAARRRGRMVSPTQLSVLRMIPIARRIARAGRGRLAVFRLLNSVRGWDTDHTPVSDAWWALNAIAERLGGARPACLVGHSLGGRAALFAASSRSEVRRVVALAPWFASGDNPGDLGEREILFVHGTRDRVAPISRSFTVAQRISHCSPVSFQRVEGAHHAMLRHHRDFSRPAAEWARAVSDGGYAEEPRGFRRSGPSDSRSGPATAVFHRPGNERCHDRGVSRAG